MRWLFHDDFMSPDPDHDLKIERPDLTINGDTERPWSMHEWGTGGVEQWARVPDAFNDW